MHNDFSVRMNTPALHFAGPVYDLSLTEVRDHSMVVEWKKPVYTGSGPITGYHVEYCKTGTSEWITATETAVHQRFFKVRALEKMIPDQQRNCADYC